MDESIGVVFHVPVLLAILLGVVQGVTEFLPISSDGHLAVLQIFFGQRYDLDAIPLAYDVFLHLATLIVTFHFLRKEAWSVLLNIGAKTALGDHVRKLAIAGFVACLPVAIVGIFFKDQIEASFHSLTIAGLGFLVTAALLEFAHRKQLRSGGANESYRVGDVLQLQVPGVLAALLIGVAQSTAVLPGVSRSGTTIAAALLLGMSPVSAVRFSFLLAIPAVFGAVVFKADDIVSLPPSYYGALAVGFGVTFLAGWIAIRLVPVVVTKLKLRYFAIYLVPLALVCLFFGK